MSTFPKKELDFWDNVKFPNPIVSENKGFR